jgi:hypothetical protein
MGLEQIRVLSLFGLIGPVCATAGDGELVNTVVQDLLNQGCSVQLDFFGVKLVTPSFYAAVTHDLHSVFPHSDLKHQFTICNLPDSFPQPQR